MKELVFSVAVSAAALASHANGPALPEAVHDLGGVTFDFARLSAERYPLVAPNVGPNILTNAWSGLVTEGATRVVALPHGRGGTFRISAWTKVRFADLNRPVGSTALMIRLGTANPTFVETPQRKGFVWNGFVKRSDQWYLATKTFDVQPGETHALVLLHCDNARIELRDVVLCEEVPQPASEKATAGRMGIKVEFCDYNGGTFQVSEDQVGELALSITKPADESYDVRKGVFILELPAGIGFVDAAFAERGSAKTETRADGSSVTRFRPASTFRPGPKCAWWDSRYLVVAATGPVGSCGRGRLVYSYDGEGGAFDARSADISFSVVPRIEGRRPKRFGMSSWLYKAYEFEDLETVGRLARFHADCGQNMIVPNAARTYPALPLWRSLGFTVLPETSVFRNGYEVSDGEIPEEDRFVPLCEPERRFEKAYRRAVCPMAILTGSRFVRDVAIPRLQADARGVDGLMANWEPFGFRGMGCCCPRCGREFARFIGRDWASVSNDWPKCAFEGGALAAKGETFRSVLHGRLVRLLDRAVRKVTGEESYGFVPEIHFGQMTSSWRTNHPMPEASPEHYAADIPWVNLWGPYVPWMCSGRYFKERAKHVIHFAYAQDLRRQIAADYPEGRRPRVISSPEGPSGDYFMQPEAFEMNFDAYLFNGIAACCPWAFPAGSDARYWRGFANASRRAAKYEDAVSGGRPADAHVRLSAVPEYASPVERLVPYLDKWRKVPQLFSAASDFAGLRIVAVFNCWRLGEAFLTLKAKDLPPGDYRIVSHDGILWAKGRETPTYTADELAAGVFVSVGATRTRVFEIVPLGKDPLTEPVSIMTAERLSAIYAERRPALLRAAEQDRADAENDLAGVTRCD